MSKPKQCTEASVRAFDPFGYVEHVVESVLTVVNNDPDATFIELAPGKSLVDLFHAVEPLFGRFTISDAVIVHGLLLAAGDVIANDPSPKGGELGTGVCYYARSILEDFISHAQSSNPRDATARAHFNELMFDGERLIGDANEAAVRFNLSADIRCLRDGNFGGATFGVCETGELPFWLEHVIEGRFNPHSAPHPHAPAAADRQRSAELTSTKGGVLIVAPER